MVRGTRRAGAYALFGDSIRNARPHGAEDPGGDGKLTRIRDRSPYRAGRTRGTLTQPRHYLSSTTAPRAEGLDQQRMGVEREQSSGAVLCHHPCRAEAAGDRDAELDTHRLDSGALAREQVVTVFRVVWSRVLGLIGRRHLDDDLDVDIQAHLELLATKYVQDGLPIDAARAAARREFGGVEQMKETYRDDRGWRWVEDAHRDLRHTLRSLARARGFGAVVVITLGLGIGAATAVFAVVNAVVLRPLKAPDAGRLVRSLAFSNGGTGAVPDVYTLKIWKDLSGIFEDVSAHRLDSVSLIGTSEPEQLSVARVSEPFFRLFGAWVVAGRAFTADEDRPNGAAVAVLSHALWMRRFGGESDAVGRTLALGNVPHLIVGIIGPDFDSEQFEPLPDVWVPL